MADDIATDRTEPSSRSGAIPLPLVVVGGGIGGLALASLLAGHGRHVTVLDAAAAPTPSTGGAFLNLAPNGMQALRTVGVADAVAAIGWHSTAIEFRNHVDRTIGRIDTADEATTFGVENRMVRRADLHGVLRRHAVELGVDVRDDHRVTAIHERPDAVSLDCGQRRLVARLVVGADGVHSRVRDHVVPGTRPNHLGLVDVAGFAPAPPGLPVGQQTMWFGRQAFLGAFAAPDGEAWWFSNLPRDRRPSRDELRDTDAWLDRARHAHRDDPPVLRDVLAATEPIVGAWPITDLPSLPTWHTDRVCLLGDAAHASSPSAGQGASLALEDAVELTAVLLDGGLAAESFARFEERRRDRVEAAVRAARRNTNRKAPGAVGRVARDLILPVFLRLGAREAARAHDWTPPLPSRQTQAPSSPSE